MTIIINRIYVPINTSLQDLYLPLILSLYSFFYRKVIDYRHHRHRSNKSFFGKSPLIITHKETGTAFYFHGVDDPIKIKSAKIAKGYVMSLWFEECSEFKGVEDIDTVEDTFIREQIGNGRQGMVYYSYNPPRNTYSWINEWKDNKVNDPDYFLHHSTYLDDEKGFLSPQLLRKIDKYKENDHDYWRWMYSGEVIGLGDNVYNMNHFHWIDELPQDDHIILIDVAIDTGHQVSASTYSAFALTRKHNVILLDTYYYSPANKTVKKSPSELGDDLNQFMNNITEKYNKYFDTKTIDSAEGALRNQFYKDHHDYLRPVRKFKKITMIDHVQQLLAEGRFYMLRNDNNQIFYDEHKKYQWDETTFEGDDPKVIKEDDHSCDVFQYYTVANLRKLGLKW